MTLDEIIAAVLGGAGDGLIAAYGFGSAGTDAERRDSDVDIAVLCEAPCTSIDALRDALEVRLGKTVDLIDLRRAPAVLRKEIVLTGRRILCQDAFAADAYEAHVLSAYQKLSQERAGIVAAGLESGGFYGP